MLSLAFKLTSLMNLTASRRRGGGGGAPPSPWLPIVGVPLVLLVALALPLVPRLGVAGPLARV